MMESGFSSFSISYCEGLDISLTSLNLNFSICKMGLIIVAKYNNYFYKEQMWKCFVNSKALYKVKQLLSALKHPFIGVANWISTLLKEIKIKQAVLDNPV